MEPECPKGSANATSGGLTPDSRPYIHDKCGQITVISGYQFKRITNPFEFILSQTYCAGCQKVVRLKTVAWADTGETISRYRRRMWRTSPLAIRLLSWYIGPLAAAALGISLGMLFPGQKVPAPFVGGVSGFILALTVMPLFLSWTWRIDYRNMK